MSGAALAQDAMNKTVSGHIISSSAFDLAIQTDAGSRLNLVLDSSTSKPAILAAGDQVTVVYRTLDNGGFQAIQVLEGTSAAEPAKAAGSATPPVTSWVWIAPIMYCDQNVGLFCPAVQALVKQSSYHGVSGHNVVWAAVQPATVQREARSKMTRCGAAVLEPLRMP